METNVQDNRVGFACKLLTQQQFSSKKEALDWLKKHNTTSTTVANLSRMSKTAAIDKIISLLHHNSQVLKDQFTLIKDWPLSRRMIRIGSELMPVRTHPNYMSWYEDEPSIRQALQSFAEPGRMAREWDIRLSTHPGQFCCIVSDNPDVVERSILELEYHAEIARLLGYNINRLDFKINVHLSGRLGVNGFDSAWAKMSQGVKNCLTLENDEYQAGLDDIILLKDKVGIVLDLHHHWIHSGEYILPDDPRIQKIVESWAGVRPVFHYSQSRPEYLTEYQNIKPDYKSITKQHSRSKLRAHSDFYNHYELNKWALEHLVWGDMMAESKMKNLAAEQLFNQLAAPI